MKIKTSELEGAALDWAVGMAINGKSIMTEIYGVIVLGRSIEREAAECRIRPSTSWAQGGPLIQHYKVDFAHNLSGKVAAKCMDAMRTGGTAMGENHLIAAMRAIVASELGDEVDIPEEIIK